MNEDQVRQACEDLIIGILNNYFTDGAYNEDRDEMRRLTLAFARQMQAMGLRQGGDIADDHSCKKDYGLCNCPRYIMLECETKAMRLETPCP